MDIKERDKNNDFIEATWIDKVLILEPPLYFSYSKNKIKSVKMGGEAQHWAQTEISKSNYIPNE